jgi:hypothetical protein
MLVVYTLDSPCRLGFSLHQRFLLISRNKNLFVFILTKFPQRPETSRKLALFQTKCFSELPSVENESAKPLKNPRYKALIEKYQNVFTKKIGKLVGYQAKLHIDHSVVPRQKPLRLLAFCLVKATNAIYDDFLEQGILQLLTTLPTGWLSEPHIVLKPKKPGEVRLTIDCWLANNAIKRMNCSYVLVYELFVRSYFLVYGVGVEDHDKNFAAIIERFNKLGLTTAEDNCTLAVTELDFFGVHL